MNRLLFFTILISSLLSSNEFKTIFQKSFLLDDETIKLELINPPKLKITHQDNKIITQNLPFDFFNDLEQNSKKGIVLDLTSSVNIFDIDYNGKKDIIIFGGSYQSVSETTANLIILEERNGKFIQKLSINATNNYEIKYYSNEDIIILAQNIQRLGLESRFGDSYIYQFYVYDTRDNFKKIPLMLSNKKLNSNHKDLIEQNLKEIIKKYHTYKRVTISLGKKKIMVDFVKEYWNAISERDLNFISKIVKDKVDYYNKKISKEALIQDKKRALKRVKEISFKLSDFLVYKKGKKYYVEYTKEYVTDDYLVSGVVKSLMIIESVHYKYRLGTEKDIAILSLGKDGK